MNVWQTKTGLFIALLIQKMWTCQWAEGDCRELCVVRRENVKVRAMSWSWCEQSWVNVMTPSRLPSQAQTKGKRAPLEGRRVYVQVSCVAMDVGGVCGPWLPVQQCLVRLSELIQLNVQGIQSYCTLNCSQPHKLISSCSHAKCHLFKTVSWQREPLSE